MFYWHGYPYTNFHELNLDWVLEKVRENKDDITDIKNYLSNIKPNDPGQPDQPGQPDEPTVPIESNIIYVTPDGRFGYQTITSAVDYAKGKISAGASVRYLVVVLPGVYNEAVNLLNNPGIDMIAPAGATIETSADYPFAPIYTSGEGYFEGFKLVNHGNCYAMHFESGGTNKNGNAIFRNCDMIADKLYAAGIGTTGFSSIEMYVCRMYSYSDSHGAMLFHNNHRKTNKSNARFIDCDFVHTGGIGMVIQDAAKAEGLNFGDALVDLQIQKCYCSTIYYTENTDIGIGRARRLPNGWGNINLAGDSYGNSNPVANLSDYNIGVYRMTCHGDGVTGTFYVPVPMFNRNDWYVAIKVFSGSNDVTSQMNINRQGTGNFFWIYGEPSKNANVDVEITVKAGYDS